MFSGRSENQDGRLWLAGTFSISPLNPHNGIQPKLTGSTISTSSTKFVLFGTDQKTKIAALADDIVLRRTICDPCFLNKFVDLFVAVVGWL